MPRVDATSVLVIDDSSTFRERLGAILRDAGYSVRLAASGAEGIRSASQIRPDAIIVDGVMPGDGRHGGHPAHSPGSRASRNAVPAADRVRRGDAARCLALDAGADAYVRKTEDTDVVLARSRRC